MGIVNCKRGDNCETVSTQKLAYMMNILNGKNRDPPTKTGALLGVQTLTLKK